MKPDKWQVAHKETHSAYLRGHLLLLPTPGPWQRLNILCTHRDHQPLTLAVQKGRSLLGFPTLSVVNAVGVDGAQQQPHGQATQDIVKEPVTRHVVNAADCLMSHQTHKPLSCPLQLFSSQGSADHQFLLPFFFFTWDKGRIFLPSRQEHENFKVLAQQETEL